MPTLTSGAKGTIATLTSPGCFAAFFNVVSRLCAAVFRWVILELCAIEPVLSSTSARLSFLMPQKTSADVEMLIVCWPSSLVNIGVMVPLPVSLRMKLLAYGEENSETT